MIRRATIHDLEKISEINKICLPENYDSITWMSIFLNPNAIFFIAYDEIDETKIIAYCVGMGTPTNTTGYIVSFAVCPDYRKKGIGETLIKKTIKELSCTQEVSLHVRVGNVIAQKLYQKLNFIQVSVEKQYYRDGEDAYVMTMKI